MSESYRGQCNLHLHFAKQYLADSGKGAESQWSGHYQRACAESALWQLRLAYECHLADLLIQQPLYSQTLPSGRMNAQLLTKAAHPPEIAELADREIHDDRLKWMLDYRFLRQPGDAKQYNPSLLSTVTVSDQDDIELAKGCLQFLSELIARHRSTLLEY